VRDHIEFFRQFRQRFKTTGSIAPSSRFLASAMTGPLERCERPVRILEIGPGTGAVTRRIVSVMKPADRLDLVELNETFVALLERRFAEDPVYQAAAPRSKIHNCPLQEFSAGEGYDFIISGLPLNNFEAGLVRDIFEAYFRLLAPQGVLSYFEYMYVRTLRRYVSAAAERDRMRKLDAIMQPYVSRHRFRQDWVFANLPPAWVQHLRKADAGDGSSQK
jgi:phospholipid N-methyltransferase